MAGVSSGEIDLFSGDYFAAQFEDFAHLTVFFFPPILACPRHGWQRSSSRAICQMGGSILPDCGARRPRESQPWVWPEAKSVSVVRRQVPAGPTSDPINTSPTHVLMNAKILRPRFNDESSTSAFTSGCVECSGLEAQSGRANDGRDKGDPATRPVERFVGMHERNGTGHGDQHATKRERSEAVVNGPAARLGRLLLKFVLEQGRRPDILHRRAEGWRSAQARFHLLLKFLTQMAFQFLQRDRGFHASGEHLLTPFSDCPFKIKHIFRFCRN
jgi:hypothetical protein